MAQAQMGGEPVFFQPVRRLPGECIVGRTALLSQHLNFTKGKAADAGAAGL